MASKETNKEAFRRLATKRTKNVIEKIRILGHCANSQLYEYSEEDVRKIFKAIENELKSVKAKFSQTNEPDFKL